MLSDDARKRLTAYCPKVHAILIDPFLADKDKDALIMSALIARIIEKGEWEAFYFFGIQKYKVDHIYTVFPDADAKYIAWLISSPAHFAEVVGEWLTTKGEK